MTSLEIFNGSEYSIVQGKIGVYYNFCAASAGSYCYGDGSYSTNSPTSDPDPTTLQDAKEDICPKGWRLPTGGSDGEYNNLYMQYSSDAERFEMALKTPLSGYFTSGHSWSQDNEGRF